MPTDYHDSRDFVAIRPIQSSSHVGLKITARCSTPVYTCENPTRKTVAKDNFDRRDYQIKQCGYRSVNYKPYKEVGEVILNERELILRALDQFDAAKDFRDDNEIEGNSSALSAKNNTGASKEDNVITIMQPKLSNLQTLNQQFSKGRELMHKVKLGIGLFKFIKEERDRKVLEAELKIIENEEKSKRSMKAPSAELGHGFDDEEIDLTRYMVRPPTRTTTYAQCSDRETELRGTNPHLLSANDGLRETMRSGIKQEVPSSPNQVDIRIEEIPVKFSTSSTCTNESSQTVIEKNHTFYSNESSAGTAKSKVLKSKKYRQNVPRPFSPIFTNVNFYETESRIYTFRQLCVIYWILEAMSLDQPVSMPPISTCWKLSNIKEDLHTSQLKSDRNKSVDPIWKTFLSNPKKFTRGRTGRQGTLLQRRVSVAPHAIRKILTSQTSTNSGYRLPVSRDVSDDDRSSNSGFPIAIPRMRSKTCIEAETNADHSPETDRSSKIENRRRSTLSHLTQQGHKNVSLPSFKEKAYTVKEVIIARNVFHRRGSKARQSRSPSVIPNGRKPLDKFNTARKRSKENTRKLKEDTSLEIPPVDDLESESLMKDDFDMKQESVAAAIATFGEISTNPNAANFADESKEKFEELASENALVLHDNLELRERKNIESMQRKFFALRVMSDVNKAIHIMRSKSRLKDETDEEKKVRFSEECSWYKSLLDNLPPDVRDDRNNALVLDKIAKYGSLEGRKISSTQFIRVLSLLRPWELCYPDISAAIEFVRDKIVDMDKTEFEDWFQSRI